MFMTKIISYCIAERNIDTNNMNSRNSKTKHPVDDLFAVYASEWKGWGGWGGGIELLMGLRNRNLCVTFKHFKHCSQIFLQCIYYAAVIDEFVVKISEIKSLQT